MKSSYKFNLVYLFGCFCNFNLTFIFDFMYLKKLLFSLFYFILNFFYKKSINRNG
ncbi:hypothetical protein HanIR_Chr16g0823591 [Helianthus annuus]|nr:hypothetical protein HanIR_Chr16g0823591 [Helianthus annuus]